MRKVWAWTVAILGALVAVAAAVFTFGRRKEAEGKALGGLEDDRKRVKDAADSDEETLNEWRKQQNP